MKSETGAKISGKTKVSANQIVATLIKWKWNLKLNINL